MNPDPDCSVSRDWGSSWKNCSNPGGTPWRARGGRDAVARPSCCASMATTAGVTCSAIQTNEFCWSIGDDGASLVTAPRVALDCARTSGVQSIDEAKKTPATNASAAMVTILGFVKRVLMVDPFVLQGQWLVRAI